MRSRKMAVLALAVILSAMGLEAHAKGKAKGELTGVVNINEAGVAQLMMLPGIGQKRAEAVREYAQAHPFKGVEELKAIKGIGEKGFAKLKPFVTVSGPTSARLEKGAVSQSTAPKPAQSPSQAVLQ